MLTVSEFAKGVPTQMRTCPECKKQVPHRKVLIKGGIITEAWRPVRHCKRCDFIPESQPKKPGRYSSLHVGDVYCQDHKQPCHPEPGKRHQCAACKKTRCGPDKQRRADLKAKAAADKLAAKAAKKAKAPPPALHDAAQTKCPRAAGQPWCRQALESPDGCPGAAVCEGLGRAP